jgi:hypothetical protein
MDSLIDPRGRSKPLVRMICIDRQNFQYCTSKIWAVRRNTTDGPMSANSLWPLREQSVTLANSLLPPDGWSVKHDLSKGLNPNELKQELTRTQQELDEP